MSLEAPKGVLGILSLIALVAATGCLGDEPPSVSLEAVEGEATDIDCRGWDDEVHCHRVTLEMENQEEDPLSLAWLDLGDVRVDGRGKTVGNGDEFVLERGERYYRIPPAQTRGPLDLREDEPAVGHGDELPPAVVLDPAPGSEHTVENPIDLQAVGLECLQGSGDSCTRFGPKSVSGLGSLDGERALIWMDLRVETHRGQVLNVSPDLVEGPYGVEPGSSTELRLGFELPPESSIEALVYGGEDADDRFRVEVPRYEKTSWEPPISIDVIEASAVNVDCRERGTDTYCHRFVVAVENQAPNGTVELAGYHWKTPASNERMRLVEGPEELGPGQRGEIVLATELPPDGTADEVVYKGLHLPRDPSAAVPDYSIERWEPPVEIEVLSSEVEEGSCWSYDRADERCHQFRVEVVNDHPEKNASLSVAWWEIVDGEEDVHRASEVHGPGEVANNSRAKVTVNASLPGDVEPRVLRYEPWWLPWPLEYFV